MILPADINAWDDEHYFLWRERAAIMEYEGNMPDGEPSRKQQQILENSQ